mmetsp:Transcript_5199/g.14599  ORF Transcript_5199/g.14599 Transcript_5199/m.14599 type:complete len:100 (-) Transcript_5199:230-529(-)
MMEQCSFPFPDEQRWRYRYSFRSADCVETVTPVGLDDGLDKNKVHAEKVRPWAASLANGSLQPLSHAAPFEEIADQQDSRRLTNIVLRACPLLFPNDKV